MQQIYSLPPLAAREHSHMFPRSIECLSIIARGQEKCKRFFHFSATFFSRGKGWAVRSKIRHTSGVILWYNNKIKYYFLNAKMRRTPRVKGGVYHGGIFGLLPHHPRTGGAGGGVSFQQPDQQRGLCALQCQARPARPGRHRRACRPDRDQRDHQQQGGGRQKGALRGRTVLPRLPGGKTHRRLHPGQALRL